MLACSSMRRKSTSLKSRSSIRFKRCALSSSSQVHQSGHSGFDRDPPILEFVLYLFCLTNKVSSARPITRERERLSIRADKPSLNETAWLAAASYGDCKACGDGWRSVFGRCEAGGRGAAVAQRCHVASGWSPRGTTRTRAPRSRQTAIRACVSTSGEAGEAVEGVIRSRRIEGTRREGCRDRTQDLEPPARRHVAPATRSAGRRRRAGEQPHGRPRVPPVRA